MIRILFFAATFLCGHCRAAPGEPYIPASDDVVLQTVPTAVDPRIRQLQALRAQWQGQPGQPAPAAALARAYLDYARATGDARYLGRAEAFIEPWLKTAPKPLDAMLVDATILQSRHLFDDSRAELGEVLRRDPDNAQAWLTLATVAQVQGDMDVARRACAHLIGGGDALVAGACLAGLNSVTGHAGEAYHTLAVLLAAEPGAAPPVQAWIGGLMADAALYSGDDASAEAHYKAALQLAPGDNFLLADYADFLLDHQRPREAADLLRDYQQSDTSFLRLCMAEAQLRLPAAVDDAAQMAARFAATDQRGSYLYRREEALFALSLQRDPASALMLAQQNWQVQRAPQDARLLLQAAAFAAQPEAARPVLEFIARTGLREPHVDQLAAQLRQTLPPATPAAGTSP